MLSIIIAIVVARQFMSAAEKFNRTKGLWAVIGVVTFIGSQLLMGVILGLFFLSDGDLDVGNSLAINLVGLALGTGIAFLVLYLMKNNAEKNPTVNEDALLDQFDEE
ncbi:MAG: hypothetical protein P8H59_02075 [Flavobacteriales bacterium]|nr:hypothetical protein [Flavobacteriales bacterium]MDG1779711.1 hypothetical protein [Flavobacteriales bacterium]MDG2246629.1 hypothetical protein [Flavobacteriales bacterium]